MDDGGRLILASASPRRAALLQSVGLSFDVVVAGIDEAQISGETAAEYVGRLAVEKAGCVGQRVGGRQHVVLGADTCIVLDGAILGKPSDDNDARAMLLALSGRTHQVLTGVALWYQGQVISAVDTTAVTFVDIGPAMLDWYITTGEARDAAGSYVMQGQAAGFVARVEGSPSTVMGLPLQLLYALADQAGCDLTRFRH